MTKVFTFAVIGALVAVPAMAASSVDYSAICGLVEQFGGIIKTLRTLAFVGAAFYLAKWAWDFISKGEVKLDEVKDKGVGMLVGFTLLFAVGAIATVFMNMAGPGGAFNCAMNF